MTLTGSNSSNNFTEVVTEPDLRIAFGLSEDAAAYVVPLLFGLIFLVGVIGNGTIIFTVLRNKVMRNVPNILIVSLSIGDLLLIIVSVPFSATVFTFKTWPYGLAMCKFNYFMQTMSLGISIFTLTALSVDRYIAIVDPMSKHTGNTVVKPVILVTLTWLLSFIFAIPDGIFSHVSQKKTSNDTAIINVCFNYPENEEELYLKVQTIIRFLVYFAVPLLTIGFFYLMMAVILIRSGNSLPCEGRGAANQQRQIAARKKVAKVVLSFVLIFFVCWLPQHVFNFWYHFAPDAYNAFWHGFQITAFCMKFINSCVNPFALYFLSSQFRKFYKQYLCCCMPKRTSYSSLDPNSTMHNFNSDVRRTSTQNTIAHSVSQTVC